MSLRSASRCAAGVSPAAGTDAIELLGSPSSRFAKIMLPRLGMQLWDTFVTHAKQHYWQVYRSVFTPPSLVLECSGTVDITPCPHALSVSTCAHQTRTACLGSCTSTTSGKSARRAKCGLGTCPRSRARGMMAAIAKTFSHTLFGVWNGVGPCCMRFRCSMRRVRGEWLPYASHTFCHTE